MCQHCLPGNPSAGPLEVSGPHFGNHCPKWLIKLLYFRVPYGHRDHRKHLLWGPGPGHLLVLWRLAINTITDIGLRVSLYARHLSGFYASSGSKRTSSTRQIPRIYPFLKKSHGAGKQASDGRTTYSLHVLIALFQPTQKSYIRPNTSVTSAWRTNHQSWKHIMSCTNLPSFCAFMIDKNITFVKEK